MTVPEFLAAHKYYDYKTVLLDLFADDEDAFLTAWCDGTLPMEVRTVCCNTRGELHMELLLLRRISRQLQELLLRTPLSPT